MRILVTGGAGYVGSAVSIMLAGMGHEVLAVDIDPLRTSQMCARASGENPAPQWVRLSLDELIEQRGLLSGMNAVVHLAGIASDTAAERDPALTHHINVELTLELARASRDAGVRRFLMASTVAINQVPIGHALEHDLFREDDQPPLGEPPGTYARSKLAAEQALFQLSDADFSISVLRKGSLYGSAPVMRWDLMVNRAVLAAWKGEPVVLYDLGAVWRPIVHVHDAARAYAHLLTLPPWASNGLAFNLVERNARLSEILLEADAILSSASGRRIDLRHGTSQFPQRTGRASGEALRRTGWRPVLNLRKGVEDLLRRLQGEASALPPFEGRGVASTTGRN